MGSRGQKSAGNTSATRIRTTRIRLSGGGQGPQQQNQQVLQSQNQPQQVVPPPAPPANQQPQQTQTQKALNIPVNDVSQIASMTDDQLATLYRQAVKTDLPNHLNDIPDITQKFVYVAGINGKPQVLDDTQFNQFMKTNNIPTSDIMARESGSGTFTTNSVSFNLTPQQTVDMLKYSDLNYIGGKHGGQAYGAGGYFDMNGGQATNYAPGGVTAVAVLNPQTARVISLNNLQRAASAFDRAHPKFAKASGGFTHKNWSIYAIAMGYNVIKSDYGSYHNVIDRSALVFRKRDQ